MSEKKAIIFIVEGPSDEAALGSVMKEYFSSDEVQFVITHGDITQKDYTNLDNIVLKINEQIEIIKKKYRYEKKHIIKVIHITDMDGVYIPKDSVKLADVEHIQYYVDHIETKYDEATRIRNKAKGDILFKLRRTGFIQQIPYKIYYNSCNLEHVLYNELREFTDEEKEELSDAFAEQYEGKVDEFIEFISSSDIAVEGTYQQTWNYIEKDHRSLNRHSNMHLIFQ